jgi:hypothetical protein
VIEPEQQQTAGPPAGDTDGERRVQLQQARVELPS